MTRALFVLVVACSSPTFDGSLASTGTLGTWSFAPNSCRSGAAREFDGVDLFDGMRAVRLVLDPAKGPTVTVSNSGDPAFPSAIFGMPVCTQLVASVSHEDGDTAVVDGDFTLACPGLAGHIDFSSCDKD